VKSSYDFPEKVVLCGVADGAGQDFANDQIFPLEVGHAVNFRLLAAAAAVERIIRPIALSFNDAFLPGTDQGLVDLIRDDGLLRHQQVSASLLFFFLKRDDKAAAGLTVAPAEHSGRTVPIPPWTLSKRHGFPKGKTFDVAKIR